MGQELRTSDAGAGGMRARIRANDRAGPTSCAAPGFVQANLVVLPEEYAFDFLKFCVRNPKPCPILEVTEVGSSEHVIAAPGADLRTDVPRYRVYERGEIVEEPPDILEHWRDNLVSLLIGCSFTFETALIAAGLRIAHAEQGRNIPMYVTGKECVPSGPFAGPMVVGMRPYGPEELPLVVSVPGRYPSMHGSPVHVGDPEALGVRDLASPEFGEPGEIEEGQLPVFWACGVTPQAVAVKARPPLMITHGPGHMFVTDRRHSEYEV